MLLIPRHIPAEGEEPRFDAYPGLDGRVIFDVNNTQHSIRDYSVLMDWLRVHLGPEFTEDGDGLSPIYDVTFAVVTIQRGFPAEAMAFRLRWC